MINTYGHQQNRLLFRNVLIFGLVLSIMRWTSSTYAQKSPHSAESASEQSREKPKKRPLTPEQRKHHEVRVIEMRQLLKEANNGKRDDAEKYVILRHLLKNYATLDSMETTEAKEALRQWGDLLQRRPDLKANPPREIKEQRELREQTEMHVAEIQQKSETWVPKPDRRAALFWSGKFLASVGQSQINFYKLPERVECYVEYGGKWESLRARLINGKLRAQGSVFEPKFMRDGKDLPLMPFRTATFGRTIATESRTGGCDSTLDNCTAFAIAAVSEVYSPSISNNDEWELAQEAHRRGRRFVWSNPSADYQGEFYGVFSIRGDLLVRIPFSGGSTNLVLRPLYVYQDGTSLFALGKMVPNEEDPDGPSSRFGDVTEVIAWSKKNDVHRLFIEDALRRYPEIKSLQELKWIMR